LVLLAGATPDCGGGPAARSGLPAPPLCRRRGSPYTGARSRKTKGPERASCLRSADAPSTEGDNDMALVDRVKNILLTPQTEWPKIAEEPATTQSIYTGYVLILAAIAPVALLIRTGMLGLTGAVLSYVIALAITFVLALIVDALAPSFGGEKNFVQSLKLTAYSYTAAWVAGVFHLIPGLGGILALLAMIYSFYTFYLGAPVLKRCAPDKAVAFTLIVVVCGIVLGIVVGGMLLTAVIGGGAAGMMGLGSMMR
jgi:hypothetical protein